MQSSGAADLIAFVEAVTAAWRSGDRVAVKAFAADDPNVAMGGPAGAIPIAIGQEAVAALIDKIVNPLPDGAGVFPVETKGYTLGDFGWITCNGELRLPNTPSRGWFIIMVVKREAGAWKFLHFGAFAGPA